MNHFYPIKIERSAYKFNAYQFQIDTLSHRVEQRVGLAVEPGAALQLVLQNKSTQIILKCIL